MRTRNNSGTIYLPHLIVIIGQGLPIVISDHFPLVIEPVFGHVELPQPFLIIDPGEAFLPRDHGTLLRIEIDPNEPELINVYMNLEKPIRGLVK
jgi:hypothetical protein